MYIVRIFVEIISKNQYLPENKGFILQYVPYNIIITLFIIIIILFDLEIIFEICMDMNYNS